MRTTLLVNSLSPAEIASTVTSVKGIASIEPTNACLNFFIDYVVDKPCRYRTCSYVRNIRVVTNGKVRCVFVFALPCLHFIVENWVGTQLYNNYSKQDFVTTADRRYRNLHPAICFEN